MPELWKVDGKFLSLLKLVLGEGSSRCSSCMGPGLGFLDLYQLRIPSTLELDAVYFTAQDPEVLKAARSTRRLLATARRKPVIDSSGVTLDVVLGSLADPRERSARADYPHAPNAVVMTDGPRGGQVETQEGIVRFPAPTVDSAPGGAYGAGDSFAGALTYYAAAGLPPLEAATLAARHGAAVLAGLNPVEAQLPLKTPPQSPADPV